MSDDALRAQYTAALPEVRELATSISSVLRSALEQFHPLVLWRIKTWESLREKAARVGAKNLSDISDLLGVRVVVRDADALYDAFDAVSRQYFVQERQTTHLQRGDSATHLIIRSKASGPIGLRAEIQILTEQTEARRALEHGTTYKQPQTADAQPIVAPATPPRNTDVEPRRDSDDIASVQSLISTITQFENLLSQEKVHEKADVHPFIREHPFLLFPAPDSVVSEVPIGMGTEYRIDFLIRDPSGEYILVEIENPNAKVLTKSGDFTATVNHAICQVEDWQEWIEANLPMVDRVYPGIRSPEAWVIVGRDHHLVEKYKHRVVRRNINMRGRVRIKTYDELLREARSFAKSIELNLRRYRGAQ